MRTWFDKDLDFWSWGYQRPIARPLVSIPIMANRENFFRVENSPQAILPNNVLFSGKVSLGEPPVFGARVVQLRLRGGGILATTISDAATGEFSFPGWFVQRDDYEYHVIGEDKVSTSFPRLASDVIQQVNGNPRLYLTSSLGGPAPEEPPTEMILFGAYAQIVQGVPYDSGLLSLLNNVGAVSWSLLEGVLPTGLVMAPSTGRVTGTTAQTGTFPIVVLVVDSMDRAIDLQVEMFSGVEGYEYWRIDVTANNGGPYVSIPEIEMLLVAGGTDQCTGGVALANAEANASNTAAMAFDESFVNKWTSGPGSTGWIQYRFTGVKPAIKKIRINGPIPSQEAFAPKNFTIKSSNDGVSWTTRATFVDQTAWAGNVWREFDTGI